MHSPFHRPWHHQFLPCSSVTTRSSWSNLWQPLPSSTPRSVWSVSSVSSVEAQSTWLFSPFSLTVASLDSSVLTGRHLLPGACWTERPRRDHFSDWSWNAWRTNWTAEITYRSSFSAGSSRLPIWKGCFWICWLSFCPRESSQCCQQWSVSKSRWVVCATQWCIWHNGDSACATNVVC